MAPISPIIPALRWSDADGYRLDAPRVGRALESGVQGFILFGGPAQEARAAAEVLTGRAGRPLLLGSDLERGAGQQFMGATPLPPLAALASLQDRETLVRAGELTGREAVGLGIPWVFAPVADLGVEPDNPIVGTRSPGPDPERVGHAVASWIRGCLSAGAIPCVKHFPGHGRTLTDSHAELPRVDLDAERLRAEDLHPFRRALEVAVPSVMTAHVAYPALDASGLPATRSRAMVQGILRDEMGFEGVVVSDALIMEGAGQADVAAREALDAGVDLLLYPPDELSPPQLPPASAARVRALVGRVPPLQDVGVGQPPAWGRPEDRAWAVETAIRTIRRVNSEGSGWIGSPATSVALTVVDDDLGGPWPPPSRGVLPDTLRRRGCELSSGGHPILALYADPRAWKGRAGLGPEAVQALDAWHADAPPEAPILLFGGPSLVRFLPAGRPVVLAWGGEPLMQEAAATWLTAGGAE